MFSKSFLITLGLLISITVHAAPDWRAIMGPSEGNIPSDPAQDEIVWLDDLDEAFKQAKEKNRPMFITFRCPPCKQCSWFDAVVLRGSPTLTPLYEQFVTARITDAAELDTRIFKIQEFQDLDLSWWGYFLSPEGRIYGVYGGKDHISDKTRVSEDGLVDAMNNILAHHYDPRRASWDIDGPAPEMAGGKETPYDLPYASSYANDRPYLKKQACLHCHQVNDIIYNAKMQDPNFEKVRDIAPWPFPENVGMELDLDDNLLVAQVEPGGPAANAGLQEGDRIVVADGRKLFSNTDFRAVLHRADPNATSIDVYYNRNGQPAQAIIQTEKDWKKTLIHWRKSIYDGPIGPSPGFFPLKGPNQGKGSLSLKAYTKGKQNHPAVKAGLTANAEVIAVDGMNEDMDTREFLTWFKMNYSGGDKVTLTVKAKGQTKDITFRLPRS